MDILITRSYKKDSYTVGKIYVNGKRFGDGSNYCNTLEDKDRGLTSDMSLEEISAKKVYGKTAIPTGTYTVKFTYSPKFHNRTWAVSGTVPELLNVKGFSGVRIHPFNTAEESLGCISLGRNNVKGKVTNSNYWCSLLYDKMSKAIRNGETIKITMR